MPTVWAACWFPWVMYFLHRALEEKRLWLFAMVSAGITLCFFEGHPENAYFITLIAGAYLVYAFFRCRVGLGTLLKIIFFLGTAYILFSGCQLLPILELVPRSIRSEWGYTQMINAYLSPSDFTSFFLPWPTYDNGDQLWHGPIHFYWIYANYIGLIPFLFFLSGFGGSKNRKPPYWFFFAIAVLFSLFSLGDSTLLSHVVYLSAYKFLPFFNHMRAPFRSMVVPCFALACCAGLALETFRQRFLFQPDSLRVSLILPFVLFLTAADLWFWGVRSINIGEPYHYTTLGRIGAGEFFPKEVAKIILEDRSYPRVKRPNTENRNLYLKIAQVQTNDMFYIKEMDYFLSYGKYIDTPVADLIGLKYLHSNKKLSRRWKQIIPDHYINGNVFPRAFLAGGCKIFSGGITEAMDVIQQSKDSARSFVLLEKPPGISFIPSKGIAGDAQITSYRNNEVKISCDAARPCFLFLSDPDYPGWEAWLDGKKVPLYKADGLFGPWLSIRRAAMKSS